MTASLRPTPRSQARRRSPGGALLLAGLLLAGLFAAGIWQPVADAAERRPAMEKAELRFGTDRTAYRPGEPVLIAARLDIDRGWHVNSNPATFDFLIPTELSVTLPEGWAEAQVRYPPGEMQTFAFADEPLSVYDGRTLLLAELKVPETAAEGAVTVALKVLYQACDHSTCLQPVEVEEELILTVGAGGEPANGELFSAGGEAASSGGHGGAGQGGRGLLAFLAIGLLGGLILNAMPCVLPVLSLKVFGLVKSAGEGRRQVTVGGLATAAGILLSFWALAGAAIAAKSAGSAVGWGIQFQNPAFVTFLAVVVLLFCLNLWGLFEIPLPGRLAQAGAGAAGREGIAGHFASGLFATLMATPCSAPFLGTAMGFALGRSALEIGAMFTAVGLGMALPYLLLAALPRTAELLPKPGPWMDVFKGLMGFLLSGAVIWLLYVLSAQVTAERLALIEAGLLVLAFFVWLASRAGGTARRRLAQVATLAAVVLTIGLAATAATPAAATGSQLAAGGGEGAAIAWQPFDRAEAEQLAAAGQLVFVDVTADWCVTCKFNERLVLETAEVAGAFERHGVVAMKADWTNRNQAIGDYLAGFDRYGIPFYVLYRPGDQPHVFSELLTRGAVVGAVEEAAGAQVASR